MYAVNDVVFDGERLANVFSLRDQAVHAQQAKPIRGLWALGKLLEMEACLDQVIEMFVDNLGHNFADTEPGKRYCMMEDWLAYCTNYLSFRYSC